MNEMAAYLERLDNFLVKAGQPDIPPGDRAAIALSRQVGAGTDKGFEWLIAECNQQARFTRIETDYELLIFTFGDRSVLAVLKGTEQVAIPDGSAPSLVHLQHWLLSFGIGADAYSPVQLRHIEKCFPEVKAQMAAYLRKGVDVFVVQQNECGPDVPPFAIAVASVPEFWIDCRDTAEEATALAISLGLNIVQGGSHQHV